MLPDKERVKDKPIEGRPNWTYTMFNVGVEWYLRIYYKGRFVAQFSVYKKYLVKFVTGHRYGSLDKAVEAHIKEAENVTV